MSNNVVLREKNNLKKSKSKDKLDEEIIESELKVSNLIDLNIGDHVVISIDATHYRHGILNKLNKDKSIIEIIYYDDDETQCNLNEFMIVTSNNELKDCGKPGVKINEITVDFNRIELYKVDYDLAEEKCLSVEETLKKANKLVGSAKYNIFVNNDEHFAIYCKTGKAAKLFIINPNDLTAKNLIGKSIGQKIASNLAQEGAQILLVNTAKHIATKFPRSAVSAGLPAAAEAAGSVIGAGLESVSTAYDIYNKHKELKEGKITDTKFKKYIARRVTRGTMSVAGGVAGGIIGQMVIPIPVVGAVVGSLVGGIVGAVAGQGEGILIGELVEVIDNKIKEKKLNASTDNLLEKKSSKEDLTSSNTKLNLVNTDSAKIEQIDTLSVNKQQLNNMAVSAKIENNDTTQTYHVLDKLVFKFDQNLLKPEKWEYLNKNDAKQDNQTNELNKNDILENANDKINDEDYEIYILNDSNEIVKNLDLENCIDSNGAISKRNSLEAFSADKLPSNINVFFKVLENISE